MSPFFESFANGIWIISVGSGLLVLGVAGVWITHLTEKLSSDQLNARFHMQKVLIESGIRNLYFFEGNKDQEEEKTRFRGNFLNILKNGNDEICVIAIAFRSCLHGGDIGFASEDFKQYAKEGRKFRILLLHPFSEPAFTRGTHEHELYKVLTNTRKLSCSNTLSNLAKLFWRDKKIIQK